MTTEPSSSKKSNPGTTSQSPAGSNEVLAGRDQLADSNSQPVDASNQVPSTSNHLPSTSNQLLGCTGEKELSKPSIIQPIGSNSVHLLSSQLKYPSIYSSLK